MSPAYRRQRIQLTSLTDETSCNIKLDGRRSGLYKKWHSIYSNRLELLLIAMHAQQRTAVISSGTRAEVLNPNRLRWSSSLNAAPCTHSVPVVHTHLTCTPLSRIQSGCRICSGSRHDRLLRMALRVAGQLCYRYVARHLGNVFPICFGWFSILVSAQLPLSRESISLLRWSALSINGNADKITGARCIPRAPKSTANDFCWRQLATQKCKDVHAIQVPRAKGRDRSRRTGEVGQGRPTECYDCTKKHCTRCKENAGG